MKMDLRRHASDDQDLAGPAQPPDLPFVDWQFFAGFTSGIRSREARLLGLFRDQIRIDMDQLRATECIDTWRLARHGLIGTASGIGAVRLASVVRACADRPFPDCKDQILSEFAVVIDATLAAISERQPHHRDAEQIG